MHAHSDPHSDHETYYVPPPSIWPLTGSIALLALASGFALTLAKHAVGPYLIAIGAGILLIMLIGWFGDVIDETMSGKYASQVEMSFRWGMVWFIFSEVMFFAGFFGALIAGMIGGLVVYYLKKIPVHKVLRSVMPIFIIPIIGTFITAGIMMWGQIGRAHV